MATMKEVLAAAKARRSAAGPAVGETAVFDPSPLDPAQSGPTGGAAAELSPPARILPADAPPEVELSARRAVQQPGEPPAEVARGGGDGVEPLLPLRSTGQLGAGGVPPAAGRGGRAGRRGAVDTDTGPTLVPAGARPVEEPPAPPRPPPPGSSFKGTLAAGPVTVDAPAGKPGKCRSCGAEVIWWPNPLTQKTIPLEARVIRASHVADADSRPVTLFFGDGGASRVWTRADGPLLGRESHFAHCPQAGSWRT